jgi:hypothetical protein
MLMCRVIGVVMGVMAGRFRVKQPGGQTERGTEIQDAIGGAQPQGAQPAAAARRPKTVKLKRHKSYAITFYKGLDIGVILAFHWSDSQERACGGALAWLPSYGERTGASLLKPVECGDVNCTPHMQPIATVTRSTAIRNANR